MKKDYGKIFDILVEQEGYKLLSEYKKNNNTKVKLNCPKGHLWDVIPKNFKRGIRCPKCSNKCPIQAKEQFDLLVEQEGYEILSEYKGALKKVKIRCNKGHEYEVKPNDFKSGYRCPKCSGNCPIQAKEQFIQTLDQEGYELLGEYKNTYTKVKLMCPEGHEYKVIPDSYKQGYRCPKCSGNCPIQAKEHFDILVEQEGYELLSEYKKAIKKVKIRCNKGHEYEVKPNDFKNGRRCPHCAGSTGQRLLQKMLKEHIQDIVIYNDREVLGGLELDIYYPELRIGIEYQGNYWHNRPETKERDERKKLLCKEINIKLLEVWDVAFMKDQEKELDKIIRQIYNWGYKI
ncbi:MAG: hypothetical protein KQ78_02183 [Candidatus Izimaplasma bacterium HR2]|nr:MAG: hypothetical protein KQ78_02183 [Candidatus Izimaplasma bacterium HR2]